MKLLPKSKCVVCYFKPSMTLCATIGFTPVEGNCNHNKNKICEPNFQPTKFRFLLPTFMTILVCFSLFYQTASVLTFTNLLQALRYTTELLYGTCSILLLFISVFYANRLAKIYNVWITILHNIDHLGFSSFLSEKRGNIIKLSHKIYIGMILLYNAYVIFYLIWMIDKKENFQDILREIVVTFCMLVQVPTLAIFNFLSGFTRYIIENFTSHVVYHLGRRTRSNEKFEKKLVNVSMLMWKREGNLLKNLRNLRNYYAANVKNFNSLGSLFGITLVVWFLQIILLLILNFYIIYESSKKKMNMHIILLEYRTHTLILYVIAMIHNLQIVTLAGNDLISYLFRYPISKLTAEESFQVEMLISTLNIQQPLIKVSDMFVVGTGLISSIAGTIVTYVLVALQFNPFWAKLNGGRIH